MKTLTQTTETTVMKFNQYEWDPENDVLGNGAFAEVFKAKTGRDNFVALKIYREAMVKGTGGSSSSSKYTLEQEYEKGKLLSHTNVIRYIDIDYIIHEDAMQRQTSYPVLVMEYADAGSLAEWLKSPAPPTVAESTKIISEILNGLGYLHGQGIIHRDLKPGNILFKKDRMGNHVVKISDFGISRDVLEDNTNRQSTTAGIGTLDYMAPEQFLKKTYGLNGAISNRTDLWAVGVIFYRLLTGRMPYGANTNDYEGVQNEIMNNEPDYSKVPVPYRAVIKACLQKQAAARPDDADAVLKLMNTPQKEETERNTTLDDKDRDRTRIQEDPFKVKKQDNNSIVPPKPSPVGKYIAMAAGAIVVIFFLFKILSGGVEQVTNKELLDSRNISYTYTGRLKDGQPDGTGTAVYKNGDSYTGDWKDGKPNGKGATTYSSGSTCEGDYKDFLLDGHATYNYGNGNKYDGEWKHGVKEGSGTFTFKNRDQYSGTFSNDKYNGQGTYTFATGEVYQGGWRDGMRDGNGTETLTSGSKYNGQFSNDKRNGHGTLVLANGDRYEGDFVNGSESGKGIFSFNADGQYKGDKYDGQFLDGYFSGHGTYYWSNGDVYEGQWATGKRSGQGTMTYKDGSKYTESWLYGVRISTVRN